MLPLLKCASELGTDAKKSPLSFNDLNDSFNNSNGSIICSKHPLEKIQSTFFFFYKTRFEFFFKYFQVKAFFLAAVSLCGPISKPKVEYPFL